MRHSLKLLDVVRLPFQFTHPGGVRRILLALVFTERVFQFTHPGGVRRHEGCLRRSPTRFNSRTREGCDKSPQALNLERSEFQFTHPGGVRHVDYSQYRIAGEFQFTHPGGVRHTTRSILPTSLSFNSRTREGCDSWVAKHVWYLLKFQFTHPGGVRLGEIFGLTANTEVSIHAPGRGATGLLS